MKLGHILWAGAGSLVLSGIVYAAIPKWFIYPDRDAPISAYSDVGMAAGTELQPGYCKALASDIKKAMADGRLTYEEVHQLKNRAYELATENKRIDAINSAIIAAGQTPKMVAPDCYNGYNLF